MITTDLKVIEQHLREGEFQRALALVTAVASLLGGLEVAYEHYRGSYNQRIMYTPVILSAILLIVSLISVFSRFIARTLLPFTSLLMLLDGVVGFIYHARGIARKPGGWRLPIFNLIMGPPLFAPLLLEISGFLGIITSLLRRAGDLHPTSRQGAAPVPPVHDCCPARSSGNMFPRNRIFGRVVSSACSQLLPRCRCPSAELKRSTRITRTISNIPNNGRRLS